MYLALYENLPSTTAATHSNSHTHNTRFPEHWIRVHGFMLLMFSGYRNFTLCMPKQNFHLSPNKTASPLVIPISTKSHLHACSDFSQKTGSLITSSCKHISDPSISTVTTIILSHPVWYNSLLPNILISSPSSNPPSTQKLPF